MAAAFDADLWEGRLRGAMLASDVAALDALLDEGLFFSFFDGRVFDKASDLAAHREGVCRIRRLDPSERQVRDLGDVAVVAVRMALAGDQAGQPVEADLRYTRVWARQGEAWRVVAGSVVQVAAAC